MRERLIWLFANPRRLRTAFYATVSGVALLFVLAVAVRVSGPDPRPAASVTASAAPVFTNLIAPEPELTDEPPTTNYGDSTQIALQAVQFYLDHDVKSFGDVAEPDAAEEIAEAPAPRAGQKIIGSAAITEPGPTQQTVTVPTTDGVMELVMVVSNGAWTVGQIQYAK